MASNIIILGMARSGTSLAASIFARQGYYVADDETDSVQQADKFNPSGYWESGALMARNKEILRSVGFEHDNTWFFEPITPEQTAQIHELTPSDEHRQFITAYDAHSPWLWKDPRLCYTLQYWWPLLDSENTRVMLVTRDHQAIINSFKRVANTWETSIELDDDHIEQRINMHLDSARAILRRLDIPHIEVDYSEYKASPVDLARRLSGFAGIELTAADLGYTDKANHSSLWGNIIYQYGRLKAAIKSVIISLAGKSGQG